VLLGVLQRLTGIDILIKHLAELALRGQVLSNFLAHNLGDFTKAFDAENASTVALAARKSFLVDLTALAFETRNRFFDTFFARLVRVRNKNLAASLSFVLLHFLGLVSLADGSRRSYAIAAHVVSLNSDLSLRGDSLVISVSVGIFGLNCVGDRGGVNFWNQVAHISGHVDSTVVNVVISHGHLVLNWAVVGDTGSVSLLHRLSKIFKVGNTVLAWLN